MANGVARWDRRGLLLVLHLYWRIPFGQQHARNGEVRDLARILDRTPGSVAMKLNNFTSLDPAERARGVAGLRGASALDRATWTEFVEHYEDCSVEAEHLWQQASNEEPAPGPVGDEQTTTETERRRVVRTRLGQGFFRRVVLANFRNQCALTGLRDPALVNASHILGWADNEAYRLHPGNGIALNRLHDAAFDAHLVTFDDSLSLVVGRRALEASRETGAAEFLAGMAGRRLADGMRDPIDREFLARHRAEFERLGA